MSDIFVNMISDERLEKMSSAYENEQKVEINYRFLAGSQCGIPRWKCNTETLAESGVTAANCFVFKIE